MQGDDRHDANIGRVHLLGGWALGVERQHGLRASTTRTIPAIRWSAAHVACTPPTRCETNGSCVPALGQGQQLCVFASGDVGRPAGFTRKLSTSDDVTDGRSCSACTCGAPTGSCSGEVMIRDGSCVGFPRELVRLEINQCHIPTDALFGVESISVEGFFGPSGGSCTASTSQPSGNVTPTTNRTVCCR